jgi:hypothetical protein
MNWDLYVSINTKKLLILIKNIKSVNWEKYKY